MEEAEEELYIDKLGVDLNDEQLQSIDEVIEELMDENMEEEGEYESLSTDLKGKLEEEIELDIPKKVSEESFLSLPVTKLCTVMKLKNKFNFFDRVSQTKKILLRVRLDNIIYFISNFLFAIPFIMYSCNLQNKETQTPITKKFDFAAFVTLSNIYDAYQVDFAILKEKKDKEMREKLAAHMSKKNTKSRKKTHNEQDQSKFERLKVAKILEKVISLNDTDAIAQGKIRNIIVEYLTL